MTPVSISAPSSASGSASSSASTSSGAGPASAWRGSVAPLADAPAPGPAARTTPPTPAGGRAQTAPAALDLAEARLAGVRTPARLDPPAHAPTDEAAEAIGRGERPGRRTTGPGARGGAAAPGAPAA